MALPTRDRTRTPSSWDPTSDIERAAHQMSELFDHALRGAPELFEAPDAFSPFADLEETDDAYVMTVELPGVSKGDIDIQSHGRRITVSGERKEEERTGLLRKRTRSVGRFFHEVVLPGDIDEDAISASLDKGVLTVTVPKDASAQRRSRRIQITG